MPQFLDLPRELRDMIYMALITLERPRPSIEGVKWSVEVAGADGGSPYAYAMEVPPTTCANFLQCNRQIHDEMIGSIRYAKEKELTNVKLDCMVRFDVINYFTWLRIPVVKSIVTMRENRQCRRRSWTCTVLGRCRLCSPSAVDSACRTISTFVHQLWIDVRVMNDYGDFFDSGVEISRTAWAICDALKHILDIGPDYLTRGQPNRTTTIEELVLNVVPPPGVPEEEFLGEGERAGNEIANSRRMARDLVDMWKKIWTAEQEGHRYQLLLERIMRVRVCVNDKTYRVRELRIELERGQAEFKRIAARLGYYRA
jgi:hypothetical protein